MLVYLGLTVVHLVYALSNLQYGSKTQERRTNWRLDLIYLQVAFYLAKFKNGWTDRLLAAVVRE